MPRPLPRLAVLILALGCGERRPPPAAEADRPASRPRPDAGTPAAPALSRATEFPNAAAALQAVLATQPRVIGFGEIHAVEGGLPLLERAARGKVLLIERAPQSYVLLLEKGVAPAPANE